MKELVIDFRKWHGGHGAEVEMVESIQLVGVMITNNLFGSTHVNVMVKKAQHHLYFFRRKLNHFCSRGLGPNRQPSCSSAAWPAVFIQLYTLL
eukprot:g41883.t1